jgi:hypothetical protein
MEAKNSALRKGSIDGAEMTFSISATLNNGQVCRGEGNFIEPTNLLEQYAGSSKTLIDNATGNEYSIFVADSRFSFHDGYSKVDALL